MKRCCAALCLSLLVIGFCCRGEGVKEDQSPAPAGIEMLKDNGFSEVEDGGNVCWKFFTYGGRSKISVVKKDGLATEKAICINSTAMDGRGYFSQSVGGMKISSVTSFKISGCYRTEDVEIDKDGRCFVEATYNNDECDKAFGRKHQQIVLEPSKQWMHFERECNIEPPVNSMLLMAALYNCKGRLYFSHLSVTARESKLANPQGSIYVWREAEGLCAGFSCNGHKPSEFKDDANYFSGAGASYSTRGEPFVWNFKEKSEVDPETLFPKRRTYKTWLRLYGFRQAPAIDVSVDGKRISSFKTRCTENVDAQGEYAGGGEFYWQDAGEFVGEGGNHSLKISSKGVFGIDAILVTTDMSYRPESFEAREKSDKEWFVDIKSGPVIKAEYQLCGVSDRIASPLVFRPYMPDNQPIKINNDEPPAVLHVDLPSSIEVKNVSSHWAGTSWNSKSRWGERFLTYRKTGERTIGKERYNCYDVYLHFLGLDIFIFVQGAPGGFEYGRREKCLYWLEYKGEKAQQEELALLTVDLKPAKAFSKIFIGPCGKGFRNFYNEYPDFIEAMSYSGMNFINIWNVHLPDEKRAWDEFLRKCSDSKITVTAELSPFFGEYAPKSNDDFAVEANGARNSSPSLCMDMKGKVFQKNLAVIDQLTSEAATGIVFDDENYNQMRDKIDYGERCKKRFRAFLASKGMKPADPLEAVKDKKSELYRLWVDFKCDMLVERYNAFRAKYDEACQRNSRSTTFEKRFFIPQILRNASPQESKTDSYWDYKKLAACSTHISPMIYTYQGIKESYVVGDTVKMYNDYIGRNVVAPTLLVGHGNGGEVPAAEKKMLKYEVYECLMNKAPGIMYWQSDAFFDPVNLAQISEAIRVAQPYEDFFIDGKPWTKFAISPSWVRAVALKRNGEILLYLANYRNETDKRVGVKLEEPPSSVTDIELNVQLPVDGSGFETDFADDRGKLFLIKLKSK